GPLAAAHAVVAVGGRAAGAGSGHVVGERAAADGELAVGGDGPALAVAARSVAARDGLDLVAGERAVTHVGGAVIVDRAPLGAAAPRRVALLGIGEGERAEGLVARERRAADVGGRAAVVPQSAADAIGRVVSDCVVG